MGDKQNTPQLKLTSTIPPSVNHYLGYRAIMRNGRPFAMSYKTQEASKYQEWFTKVIRSEVKRQKWEISKNKYQHYYMDCIFYFEEATCDANNYFKCMADAITDSKLVWIDDKQLCERVQGVYYDKDNPRVEITITPVDYIGIFKDATQLENFIENNCVGCMRYKKNCRLLNRAKEGRIQPEIHDQMCQWLQGYKGKKEIKNGKDKEED